MSSSPGTGPDPSAEEVADAVHGPATEDDLEHDARGADHDAGGDDGDVLEQDPEREQHDAERRQRVEAGERWGEERGERACAGEHPEEGVARPVVEEQPRPWLRETLEAAD